MKKWNTRIIIRVVSSCMLFVCILYIADYNYKSYLNQHKQQSLSTMRKEHTGRLKYIEKKTYDNIESINKSDNTSEGYIMHNPEMILPEFIDIYEKNSDFIGWIRIPDTIIDYPVMQGEDNEYYLNHDFYGDKSKHGSLFLDCKSDVLLPSTNLIVYGHNMKDGSMFSALRNYKDQSFYEKHKYISFHTIYEKSKYEIVSVFLSKVYLKSEDVFKYYQFVQASNEEEYDAFYNNIKELSLYDTKKEAQYGDTFLTLSTCDYTTDNGRLVVVAKKIQPKVQE